MKNVLAELYERKLINSYAEGRRYIAKNKVKVGDKKIASGEDQVEPFQTIFINLTAYPYSMYPKLREAKKGEDVSKP